MARVAFLTAILMVLQTTGLSAVAQERNFGVRGISEVASGEMPQVTEITHQDAVLLFRSNIPLACSVVYGETREFGLIAVDADMDGGAHENHHPLLTGLKPDRTYYYRVQGVAPDGRVFVGEV